MRVRFLRLRLDIPPQSPPAYMEGATALPTPPHARHTRKTLPAQPETSPVPPSPPAAVPPLQHDAADDGVAALATVLAHRLRSIVGSVQGYTELLVDSLEADEREIALEILRGTAAIERTLADLLYYSRELDPAPLPVPIRPFIEQLLHAAKEPGAHVDLDCPLPPRYCHPADPVLLRQAVLILFQNAVEASPPGGRVRVGVRLDGADLAVSVASPALLGDAEIQAAFQPFHTTKSQNLGLGLPIAHKIARCHGGRLFGHADAASESTVFTLILPAAPAETAPD